MANNMIHNILSFGCMRLFPFQLIRYSHHTEAGLTCAFHLQPLIREDALHVIMHGSNRTGTLIN